MTAEEVMLWCFAICSVVFTIWFAAVGGFFLVAHIVEIWRAIRDD